MPSEWMPVIFNDGEAMYDDLAQANAVLADLMALYNEVTAATREDTAGLPMDCRFRRDILTNFATDAPVSLWSRGFIAGHDWLEESWEPAFEDDADAPSPFAAMILILSFFGSRALAEDFCRGIGGKDLDETARQMRRLFAGTMRGYAQLGRAIEAAIREVQATPVQRAGAKVGRNDPCPCGSGRKYKKCCGTH